MNRFIIPLLAVVTSIALGGCMAPASVPLSANESTLAPPSSTGRATAAMANAGPVKSVPTPINQSLATMQTYQYLRVDPDKTGVLNVADDGRFTYLAFGRNVADDMVFYDSEGAALVAARVGNVVALPGVYKGILVRSGRANSYVAPNPRAAPNDRPNLEADPEVLEARTRLEVAATQLPAFRRAIEKADASEQRGRNRDAASPEREHPLVAKSAYQIPPLPALSPVAEGDPTYLRTSRGVMIRVFFASGGRAIVRPDDGLQRLEAEARGAREIRVTGFTDNIGSDALNALLGQQRADSIKQLLVKRGVPPERIYVASVGNSRFLGDNATEAGRAMNRRVEVLFVKEAVSAGVPSANVASQ